MYLLYYSITINCQKTNEKKKYCVENSLKPLPLQTNKHSLLFRNSTLFLFDWPPFLVHSYLCCLHFSVQLYFTYFKQKALIVHIQFFEVTNNKAWNYVKPHRIRIEYSNLERKFIQKREKRNPPMNSIRRRKE